jgi:hypothetical protein
VGHCSDTLRLSTEAILYASGRVVALPRNTHIQYTDEDESVRLLNFAVSN